MADYVCVDVLLSAAEDYDWISGLKTVLKRIQAADVRPVVRGHWEDGNKSTKNPERFAFNWWCSICGTPQHTPVAKTLAEFTMENPYCHNCGADMRPREEGRDDKTDAD